MFHTIVSTVFSVCVCVCVCPVEVEGAPIGPVNGSGDSGEVIPFPEPFPPLLPPPLSSFPSFSLLFPPLHLLISFLILFRADCIARLFLLLLLLLLLLLFSLRRYPIIVLNSTN